MSSVGKPCPRAFQQSRGLAQLGCLLTSHHQKKKMLTEVLELHLPTVHSGWCPRLRSLWSALSVLLCCWTEVLLCSLYCLGTRMVPLDLGAGISGWIQAWLW